MSKPERPYRTGKRHQIMVIEVEDYTRQTIYLVDQEFPGTNLPCDVKSMTGDPRAGYHPPDEMHTAAQWMAIALATVSYHTVRAGRANPVDALRHS